MPPVRRPWTCRPFFYPVQWDAAGRSYGLQQVRLDSILPPCTRIGAQKLFRLAPIFHYKKAFFYLQQRMQRDIKRDTPKSKSSCQVGLELAANKRKCSARNGIILVFCLLVAVFPKHIKSVEP